MLIQSDQVETFGKPGLVLLFVDQNDKVVGQFALALFGFLVQSASLLVKLLQVGNGCFDSEHLA